MTRSNLWLLARTTEAKPVPLVATSAAESGGRFSPDGRYFAYTSDESGQAEVFVQPFPITGVKWKVSAGGGFQATWGGDGREFYYASLSGTLMAVTVTPSPAGLSFSVPRALFRFYLNPATGYSNHDYEVHPDGQRFLVLQHTGDEVASPMVVVVGPSPVKESKR